MLVRIFKWSQSQHARLNRIVVRKLGLNANAAVDVRPLQDGQSETVHRDPDEVLSDLKHFRGRLRERDKLDREGANER